jgi:retinol dehydrogenase-14
MQSVQRQQQALMAGKTCLITGANSGIGKATSAALAGMGAKKVVMVSRDRTKGESARAEILEKSGRKNEEIELMICDLSSLKSVRGFAAEYKRMHDRLDVLINNAGLILAKRTVTEEGFETTFVVNYLSHFLLTNLLLDLLKASAPSRIINVSSDAHTGGHMNFDDLQGETRYSGSRAYSQSKLAQILFTYELAKRLEGTGVTVNAVHPGAVATNWGRKSAGALSVVLAIFHPFELSPEKGADTVVYLASSPEVANVSGKYFTKRKAIESSLESRNEEDARRLWEVSEHLTGTKWQ